MKKMIQIDGTYINDYAGFKWVTRLTETQASEFLKLESETWNILNKGFIVLNDPYLTSYEALAIYNLDGTLWLMRNDESILVDAVKDDACDANKDSQEKKSVHKALEVLKRKKCELLRTIRNQHTRCSKCNGEKDNEGWCANYCTDT